MAYIIGMPRYGATMEEGLLAGWEVSEGDEVSQGQVICVIEIEKITNEVEAEEDGVIRKIICQEGDTLPCGAPLAILAGADEDITGLLSEADSGSQGVSESIAEGEDNSAASVPAETKIIKKNDSPSVSGFPGEVDGVKITPKALKLAEELGVDYSGIKGTGIHGAITRQDIRTNLESASGKNMIQTRAEKQPVQEKIAVTVSASSGSGNAKMSNIRKITARRMMESVSGSAQTSMMMDADLTDLVEAYKNKKGSYFREGIKLSYTAIILKAVSSALVNHPIIRTVIERDDYIRTLSDINVGVAIDADYGLTVPVLEHVDYKDLSTVCQELSELTSRAKAGTLSSDDMNGGVITVSNVGMLNVKYFTPILNAPQSAILGIGTLTQQPVVINGGFHVRWIMSLSLTYDHRIIDGAPAAKFLNEVCRNLVNTKV